MMRYGSGRIERSSIDLKACARARVQLPASKALALAWRLDCEKRRSDGVAVTTTRAAATGMRLRCAAGGPGRSWPDRDAAAAHPTANTHAVTAGSSQAQSTPACTAQATTAA